jgi:PAS domain S-box-containing protein
VRSSLEKSPVLAWLKDAAGRHLYVNRRYLEALGVAEERVLGHTDDELSPGETVDGPRRSLAEDGIEEPQELEYTVPAFGQRPAFAAVRFLVRGPVGEVLGICGLAGPLEQAQLVRQEADRIVAAERRAATPTGSQDDLLREWGVALASAAPPEMQRLEPELTSVEEAASVLASGPELDLVQRWEEWRSILQQAQQQLTGALTQRDAAQEEHDRLRGERDELERALSAERMRGEELVRTIEQLRVQISDVGRTIEQALPGEGQVGSAPPSGW